MNSLRELFEAAVELPEGERSDWLARHCTDAQQRTLIERMLAVDHQDQLGSAERLATAIGVPGAPHWNAGARVGGFFLIAPLGEGGFATVWRAARESEGVRQEVALKLPHRGLHSPEAQRQFRREREALAQLQHAAIARLIEGGVDPGGQAYIALELVEGTPITAHAQARKLGLLARLELFLQVCRAVEAAHSALIVHRDLKPSNVLVTDAGQVKLLDFGIAKLLQGDGDDTRTQLPAFTPAYAAPEQRESGAITTATDVYALGVLLGELLTGRRFTGGGGRPPSSQVGDEHLAADLPSAPAVLRRELRGDLDNVLLKALALDPQQRYASAGALADDVERYIAGLPVAAHPPSRRYRLRKFLARHRAGALAGLGFAVALLVLTGVALRQARLAREESQRAEAMRHFMVSAFKQAQPSTPREGSPRISDVVAEAIERARTDPAMHIGVRTELLSELGAVLREQGDIERAAAVLQWNHERAREAFGADDPRSLRAGLELLRARVLRSEFAPSRELADTLLSGSPPGQFALRSQILVAASWLAVKQRDFPRALNDAAAAVQSARAAGDEDLLAEALSGLSQAQFAAGDAVAAAGSGEEHLALRARQFGPEHVLVATARANLSRIYRRSGDLAAAERHVLAALAIDDETLPADDWRRARHLNALMALRREQGDFEAARAAAAEGLRINRIAYGDNHPDTINDLVNLGTLSLRLDRPQEAITPLREAVRRYRARLGDTHVETANARAQLGLALGLTGATAEGETELRAALRALGDGADPAALREACAHATRLGLSDLPAGCH
jgi:eukaryotic-like serine/threonine-protein kinase